MRQFALAPLLLASCLAAEVSSERYEAPPERLRTAIEGLLSQGGKVESEGNMYSTGWVRDSAVKAGWTGGGMVVDARTSYSVKVDGAMVEVSARTEAFVSRGPHNRRWESVDPKPARNRFLSRLREVLRAPKDR
jgi:hypothetical protein